MVREWRESEQRKLRSSTEDFEVYRAQGALKYLDMIFEMPQEIKSYMHDVATGKRRPVDKKEFEHGVAG